MLQKGSMHTLHHHLYSRRPFLLACGWVTCVPFPSLSLLVWEIRMRPSTSQDLPSHNKPTYFLPTFSFRLRIQCPRPQNGRSVGWVCIFCLFNQNIIARSWIVSPRQRDTEVPAPVNVIWFGNRVFADTIKLNWGYTAMQWGVCVCVCKSHDSCLYKRK